MPRLYARLVAGRRPLVVRAVLWTFIFTGLLAAGAGGLRWQLASHVTREQRAELAHLGKVHASALSTLTMLKRASGEPCSAEFIGVMRSIAFLPDGLNEFLYAPAGKVQCTASGTHFDPPADLGPEDIAAPAPGEASWRVDRDLAIIRHPGTAGLIAQLGDFAVAIPPYAGLDNSSTWHAKEIIVRGNGNAVWSIAGERGLHAQAVNPEAADNAFATSISSTCTHHAVFCIVSRADLVAWANTWKAALALGIVGAALVAWMLADGTMAWLAKHFSFAERFKRGLNAQSIVLAYQPIVDLKSNEVVCVEVLARWRDLDQSIVAPDRFIPLVTQRRRTRLFTQLVIDRAYEELSRLPPRRSPLLVNFNIFACDFDSETILGWLKRFQKDTHLLAAVELVEEQDVDLDKAQKTIEALAAVGVPTFIDDFGSGYSNITRVARLPVQGVKLDRSFAMSPPDSVMGQMLVQVIEMIKAAGRVIIVEGVETAARLNLLRSTGSVDLVQGYVISRPLEINDLAAFLARGPSAWPTQPPASVSPLTPRKVAATAP
jgi:sensor c-di-GMP phosphodiesterase-like protein